MSRFTDSVPQPTAASGRLLAWLVVAVFLLQCAFATHHHEGAAKAGHCVACALHMQPQAGPPPAVAPRAAFAGAVAYRLSIAVVAARSAAEPAYVRQPAQAPPRFPVNPSAGRRQASMT